MNLWVNRIGQLLILAVALFFLSCQENVRLSGFPNPIDRLKARYIEIPLSSSVVLRDSLRTSNYSFASEASRLLVGQYHDDKFGNVTANAFTQYYTTTPDRLSGTAVYDSVSLTLQLDYYHYGSTGVTNQTISIYELDRILYYDSIKNYFNRSGAATAGLLGSKTFGVSSTALDDARDAIISGVSDTFAIKVNIPLDPAFGKRIFDAAIRYRDDNTATKPDSVAFLSFDAFTKTFKGIAIKSDNGDKLIGFSPNGLLTRLHVHYHINDSVKANLDMALTPAVAFNQITSDRSGTEIAQITQYNKEFLVESENRYLQSGIGVFTKLDLSNYYAFVDTIPNILISDAELVFESVEVSDYAPPASFVLRAVNNNNSYRRIVNANDSSELRLYTPYMSLDVAVSSAVAAGTPALIENDQAVYALSDTGPSVPYNSSKHAYVGNMTRFFQKLALNKTDVRPFKTFLAVPGTQTGAPAFQSAAKSVNRAVFPKSGIKLKILYVKPIGVQ